MEIGDNITLLQRLDAAGAVILSVQLNRSSTSHQLRARSYDSRLANWVNTPYFNISNTALCTVFNCCVEDGPCPSSQELKSLEIWTSPLLTLPIWAKTAGSGVKFVPMPLTVPLASARRKVPIKR
jgi:hypothetical protein